MFKRIEGFLNELSQYSEKSRQLAVADEILKTFWSQHYRGFKGTEYNKDGIQLSVEYQLLWLPKSIRGIDVGWEKPIIRSGSDNEGEIYSLARLEEFAKKRAEALGRYRPIWYSQNGKGELTRHRIDVLGNIYEDKKL